MSSKRVLRGPLIGVAESKGPGHENPRSGPVCRLS